MTDSYVDDDKREYLKQHFKYDSATLKEKQAWDYDDKVQITISRIMEFINMNDKQVCVAFSGGADSSVLLDMVCYVWSVFKIAEPLTVMYANTSNEFGFIPKHAKLFVETMEQKHGIKIDYQVVRGKQSFVDIVKTQGYPVGSKKIARMVRDTKSNLEKLGIKFDDIKNKLDDGLNSAEYLRQLGFQAAVVNYLTGYTSKNFESKTWMLPKKWRYLIDAPFKVTSNCCNILKKEPMKAIQKKTNKGVFIGTMAVDSSMREMSYKKTGCIVFTDKVKQCIPMGYWVEQDKMRYLVENGTAQRIPQNNVFATYEPSFNSKRLKRNELIQIEQKVQ